MVLRVNLEGPGPAAMQERPAADAVKPTQSKEGGRMCDSAAFPYGYFR